MTSFEMPTAERPAIVLHGDCLDRMRELADASVHVLLTDPPAGIGFMGATWDSFRDYIARTAAGRIVALQLGAADLLRRCRAALAGVELTEEVEQLVRDLDDVLGAGVELAAWARGFVVFMVDTWTEAARVLKPGGFLCAWALPRTVDLLGLSLRLAGFQLKEVGLHLFGSGKPSGLDLGAALERQGHHAAARLRDCHTQMRPGHEHWLVAQRKLELRATATGTAVEHATGVFHVGACRVARRGRPRRVAAETDAGGIYGEFERRGSKAVGETDEPSFPPDVLLTHSSECTAERCARGCPVREIDEQSGVRTNGVGSKRKASAAGARGHVYGKCTAPVGSPQRCIGDTGTASRYFTSFRRELGAGLARSLREGRERVRTRIVYFGKRPNRRVPGSAKNQHKTVKTQALMRWLVRLLATRASGGPLVVLDPFAGSGSTAVACIAEGVTSISIELDAEHVATARARVAAALGTVGRNSDDSGQMMLC